MLNSESVIIGDEISSLIARWAKQILDLADRLWQERTKAKESKLNSENVTIGDEVFSSTIVSECDLPMPTFRGLSSRDYCTARNMREVYAEVLCNISRSSLENAEDLPQMLPTQIRNKEEYQKVEEEISAIERLGCRATAEQIQIAKKLSLLIQQYEDIWVENHLESCRFDMN